MKILDGTSADMIALEAAICWTLDPAPVAFVADLPADATAYREALREAVHLLADYHQQVQRGDHQRDHLRDELKRLREETILDEPPPPPPVPRGLRHRPALVAVRRPR